MLPAPLHRPRPLAACALDRLKERDSAGDNVSYVLARTVWSNLQYLAALAIGAKGLEREPMPARGVFSARYEGIPRDVLLAVLRHF